MKLAILLLLSLTTLTGCADLFYQRAHLEEMEHLTEGFFIAGDDFELTQGDEGYAYRSRDEIMQRTPASARSKGARELDDSITKQRRRLEAALSDEEYNEYRKIVRSLNSDSEKIYYLNLTRAEQAEYLESRLLKPRDSRYVAKTTIRSDATRAYLRQNSPMPQVGMSKSSIKQLLGGPDLIEYAGSPHLENEKWTFNTAQSSKQIFFDSGRVSGWIID